MTQEKTLTRRDTMGLSIGMLVASTAATSNVAQAADNGAAKTNVDAIQRYGRSPSLPGIPLISFAVSHQDVVYVSGITADPTVAAEKMGDVKQQTRQTLARIDALLAAAGTDKSHILVAQVWLTDMKNFAAHNDAWNAWVDPDNLPARACLHSPQLTFPGLLVEIMVTAVRKR